MTDRAREKPPLWFPRIWLFAFVAPALFAGIGAAWAGNMQRPEGAMMGAVRSPGPLDGQTFSGELGPIGKPADATDSWVFQDGWFLSKSCLECGFPRSGYSAEVRNGEVAFTTKTNCPVSDAVIVWEGTVRGREIEGVYTWTKKRWYRTVRKQFWFKGTLEDAAAGEHGERM